MRLHDIDGLVQEYSNSIANALELVQSSSKLLYHCTCEIKWQAGPCSNTMWFCHKQLSQWYPIVPIKAMLSQAKRLMTISYYIIVRSLWFKTYE